MTSSKVKCRLCLEEVKLCNSHIVPEFFYEQQALYDEKHRFKVLSTKSDDSPKNHQKGIREKLLCKACEGKFSRWENYARRVIFGGRPSEISHHSRRGIECIIDYRRFKLFQLSILWRVGISTRKEFGEVALGEHEAVLRKMLMDERPGSTAEYGCAMLHTSAHPNITSNTIHCMGMAEVDGIKMVSLLLADCFWFFFLSRSALDSRQAALFLQETGHLRILKTEADPKSYIENLARKFFTANPKQFE